MTPEIAAMRRKGLGGTDTPGHMGKHKYKTPLSVYSDKVLAIDQAVGITARMGKILEPLCMEVFGEDWKSPMLAGKDVLEDGMIWHENGISFGSPDCFLGVRELPGEMKTIGFSVLAEWGEAMTDEVPPYYHIQGTKYCGLLGVDRIIYQRFKRDDGSTEYYEVWKNQALYESLIALDEKFWREHIIPQIEPPVSSAGDYQIVTYLHPNSNGETVTATDEIEALAERYVRLLELIKPATEEKDLIRAKVCQFIGDNAAVICEDGTFTYNEEKRGGRVLRFKGRK